MSLRLFFDCGPDGKECARLVREYSSSIGKGVRMDNSFRNGSRKKWVCCDSVNCSWELRMTKKPRSRSDRKYWTQEIPCGHWYVSSMSLSHDKNCISQYQVSKDELKNLDGFKGSFTYGVHTSRNRVISSVSKVNKIDISSNTLSSTIYRAIRETEDKKKQLDCSDFTLIPPYLRCLANDNPGTYVSCQLDSEDRFLRCIVVYGPLVNFQDGLLIYGIDCCHMSCPSYNGLMMNLIGRDGNHTNQIVATAFVNTETIDNYCWFFMNCICAGVDFEKIPGTE